MTKLERDLMLLRWMAIIAIVLNAVILCRVLTL